MLEPSGLPLRLQPQLDQPSHGLGPLRKGGLLSAPVINTRANPSLPNDFEERPAQAEQSMGFIN